MTAFDPAPAAAELRRIRQARTLIAGLSPAIAPRTEAEGAAAQVALAAMAHALPPAGFKIGATGKRMQVYLGVDHPIAGFIAPADLHTRDAERRFADCLRPGVECEVAVTLARDLPPGPCTPEQAAAAVGAFIAGIELVENRYGDLAIVGTPTLVADQMYHVAAVIGDQGGLDWRGLPIGDLRGRIIIDGTERDQGTTSDLMGHPMNGLAWLAGSPVIAAFGGLKAGQTIMLGSVTPPVWLDGPATVTVSFDPLPPVTLRLI
jgi:2-keto-4-pentenoate hydratase